jgi:hypothetical protein
LVVDVRRGNSFGFNSERFIGKPTGQIQERVQAVGPEHFGIVAMRALQGSTRDCASLLGQALGGPVMCSDEEAEQLELDPVSVCGRDDGQSE